MSPGRRITRSSLHSEQLQSTNGATGSVPETEHITWSTDENPQVHTTRSSVHVQQTSRTTRATIHNKQRGLTTHSTAHVEQHRTSTDQENLTNPVCNEDNILSSQARSEQTVLHKPRKATRGLATSKIAKAASSGKLSVNFDADCLQPICANAERFNNEIGFIIRNHGTFHYKEWRLVPEAVRAPLRHYLLENFDINLCDETAVKCIDNQMRKAWKGHKYKLHSYFKEIGGDNDIEKAKRKRHPELKNEQQKDWEMLCDRWCTIEYKEIATKNTENRSKRKWGSKNGSVSTARHHIRRGMLLTSSTGQIETWRQKHHDKNGWTGPGLEELYDQMMALRAQHSPEELCDKAIMERVLGRCSLYLRGWGRSVSGASGNTNDEHTTDPNLPSYKEILEQLNEANNRVREVVDILRYNNLLPPSSTPSTNEASSANLGNSD